VTCGVASSLPLSRTGTSMPSAKLSVRDTSLHGAACHGCLLIAETSCEQRNVFLDRSFLVGTIAGSAAYFITTER
jgi:hypothetical protein